MNRERRQITLGFTEQKAFEGSHICYIFNDDEERYRTMMNYLRSGVREQEHVLYLVDTEDEKDFSSKLKLLGWDIENEDSDVIISKALEAYCPDGSFSVLKMLEVVKQFYIQSEDSGYRGSRGSGEMSWALKEGVTKKGDLIEYEARLNTLLKTHPMTACCQYDARLFDGETILDVLKVHPMMIIRGQIYNNPYYIEPEIFLKTLKR